MARDLSTSPLHFETQPSSGVPDHAESLGDGLLAAWLATRGLLAKKHAKTAKDVADRKITGREWIEKHDITLTDADVDKKVADFLYGYLHRLFLDDSDRDHKAIAKILGLKGEDEIMYDDDYIATFKKVVKNPFLIPDSWAAFDRFAPILDARWEDYQKTKFVKAPPKGLYEKAAKARDAVKVEATKQAKQTYSIDASFTDRLMSIVGRSLADKEVKDILTVAGLPIGKVIDEQALPALGVSYMGTKFDIGGKRQLGVADVSFYNKGVKSYIRGIGAEVQFAQYAGALPKGLAWTDDRAAAKKKLGKPSRDDDYNEWLYPKEKRMLQVRYSGKKLVEVAWRLPRENDE